MTTGWLNVTMERNPSKDGQNDSTGRYPPGDGIHVCHPKHVLCANIHVPVQSASNNGQKREYAATSTSSNTIKK